MAMTNVGTGWPAAGCWAEQAGPDKGSGVVGSALLVVAMAVWVRRILLDAVSSITE